MGSLFCLKSPTTSVGMLRPKKHSVISRRKSSSVRADFSVGDIQGDLFTVPNNQPRQQKNIRVFPPQAAWYSVPENPPDSVWTPEHPKPLLWDQSDKSLLKHKGRLMVACNANNTADWQKKLIMSMAMLETEYMWGRDPSKDNEGDSKNVWLLNLNLDMLKAVGYPSDGNGNDLITPDALPKIIGYLLKWFSGEAMVDGTKQKTPYVISTLNFVRDGRKGYDKGDSTNLSDRETVQTCRDYRSAIAVTYNALEQPPPAGHNDLWTTNDRLGIDVPWI